MKEVQHIAGIGLMSGSSLDGLDIARVEMDFRKEQGLEVLSWCITDAKTYRYPLNLVESLKSLPFESAKRFVEMDDILGRWMAEHVLDFLKFSQKRVDFIASHGHTIFHHPRKSSTQIGNASIIAAKTGKRTISNFRNMDTAYRGQGAPLAPFADFHLFTEYDVCINIGGIANISFRQEKDVIGYDICGANQILNYLSNEIGLEFDDQGKLACEGNINPELFQELNSLEYYREPFPKSLDNMQTMNMYVPILNEYHIPVKDLLSTMVEHIAEKIAVAIPQLSKKILLTGGGTFNDFLVKRIKEKADTMKSFIIPEEKTISYKECLLMVLLGLFRIECLPNSLSTMTGAEKDTINGLIYLPS
ncbi:MAG: anhydro-N-acetylmuramic acid kinase [Bacteroidia bacterium]|nr:anhydro-N-acetylmuramic acid kinase [Bacteroidia bacterium]